MISKPGTLGVVPKCRMPDPWAMSTDDNENWTCRLENCQEGTKQGDLSSFAAVALYVIGDLFPGL
jgi:hypothetical protein